MMERLQRLADRGVGFPAVLVLTVAALLAGGVLAFVAVQSGGSEAPRLTGVWRIGLTVQDGPVRGNVNQSISCIASLTEEGGVLGGELNCDSFGTSQEVSGFVFPQSNLVRLVAASSETTVEVLAEVVSPNQMVGSWQDGRGFGGRFVAIRSQLPLD